jgi:hypothetical protein
VDQITRVVERKEQQPLCGIGHKPRTEVAHISRDLAGSHGAAQGLADLLDMCRVRTVAVAVEERRVDTHETLPTQVFPKDLIPFGSSRELSISLHTASVISKSRRLVWHDQLRRQASCGYGPGGCWRDPCDTLRHGGAARRMGEDDDEAVREVRRGLAQGIRTTPPHDRDRRRSRPADARRARVRPVPGRPAAPEGRGHEGAPDLELRLHPTRAAG